MIFVKGHLFLASDNRSANRTIRRFFKLAVEILAAQSAAARIPEGEGTNYGTMPSGDDNLNTLFALLLSYTLSAVYFYIYDTLFTLYFTSMTLCLHFAFACGTIVRYSSTLPKVQTPYCW